MKPNARRAALGFVVLVAALLALAPAAAASAGEDDWQLSLRLGAGDVDLDGRSPLGVVLGADLEYGFTDAWAARLTVARGYHPVSADQSAQAPGGTVTTSSALLGLTYTFDVLRLVPYAEIGIGIIDFEGAVRSPGAMLAAELGAGADYLITKHWAIGGVFQYLFTPSQLFGSPMDLGGTPFYFTLSARLSRLF